MKEKFIKCKVRKIFLFLIPLLIHGPVIEKYINSVSKEHFSSEIFDSAKQRRQ